MANAQCIEIAPILGAFADGELSPEETRKVTSHLARCRACEAESAATAAIGVQLRAVAIQPNLEGFTNAVLKRLTELTPPLHVRVRRYFQGYFEGLREQFGAAIAIGAAGLATAALTALLLTPYAYRLATGGSHAQIASTSAPVETAAAAPANTVEVVEHEISPEMAASGRDPRVMLSSLDSRGPASWSTPETAPDLTFVSDQR
jgi:anti-sigma factor RsiW